MAENFLVRMKQHAESQARFRYDLEEAPDSLSNQYFPGRTVRPEKLTILMSPDAEGSWYISSLHVAGQEIVDGKVKQRKRLSVIPFMNPLDDEEPDQLPLWLSEIVLDHVNLMNRDEALRERQQEAARQAAREMFSLASEDMADEMADAIFTAIRRVG